MWENWLFIHILSGVIFGQCLGHEFAVTIIIIIVVFYDLFCGLCENFKLLY